MHGTNWVLLDAAVAATCSTAMHSPILKTECCKFARGFAWISRSALKQERLSVTKQYVLALDHGNTNSRAMIVDPAGAIRSIARYLFPRPARSSTSPRNLAFAKRSPIPSEITLEIDPHSIFLFFLLADLSNYLLLFPEHPPLLAHSQRKILYIGSGFIKYFLTAQGEETKSGSSRYSSKNTMHNGSEKFVPRTLFCCNLRRFGFVS